MFSSQGCQQDPWPVLGVDGPGRYAGHERVDLAAPPACTGLLQVTLIEDSLDGAVHGARP